MFIQSDTDLRRYIPNTLVTVSGEQSLFDKLQVELQLSEAWLTRTFGVVESTPTACRVLATDAFLRAVPSLDLVLTPNGFGVVSNNTIAPASKDRVDRLLTSLENSRDFAIDQLLHELLVQSEWRTTPQGRFFLSTLFQTPLSLPLELRGNRAWEVFQQTHAQFILTEQELADKFISCEVYARLRSDITNPDFAALIQPLQAIECQLLTGKPLPYKTLISLVDYIRKCDLFPEWHTSQTAERYQPHAFQNTKDSPAYWW
ncbi:MAG: DUF6712 family protein [Paludibacteraceae bacterium]